MARRADARRRGGGRVRGLREIAYGVGGRQVLTVMCESGPGRGSGALPGSGARTGAMRVSSILVDNTERPAAGILTPGSARAVRLPDVLLVSGVPLDGVLPGHSGGTAPESHRLPCTAGLVFATI